MLAVNMAKLVIWLINHVMYWWKVQACTNRKVHLYQYDCEILLFYVITSYTSKRDFSPQQDLPDQLVILYKCKYTVGN